MKRLGLLAATGLVFFYCVGYLFGEGYYGYITDYTDWLRIPKDEYLVKGIYAMADSFVLTTFALLLMFVLFLSYLNELKGYLFRKELSGKKKLKRGVVQILVVFVCGYLMILLVLKSAIRVLENGGKEMFNFIENSRQDTVCWEEGDRCVQGIVMYDTGHSYVVYFGSLENGGLELIPHAKVSSISLGWGKAAKERVLDYVNRKGE